MNSRFPPKIRIIISEGPLAEQSFKYSQSSICLGRRDTNDVILNDDSTVSASHAMLSWKEDDWYLSDTGSTNGTFLLDDGKKIKILEPTRIVQGQSFFMGSTCVHYDSSYIEKNTKGADEFSRAESRLHTRISGHPLLQLHISNRGGQLLLRTSSIKPVSAEFTMPYQESDVLLLSNSLRDAVLLFNHISIAAQSRRNDILAGSFLKLGEWLQYQYLPRFIQNELGQNLGSDLLLTLDPSLISIPWELAIVNDRPLCLEFNIGRQIVLPYRSKLGGIVPEKKGTRLLIIANPDGTLPEAQQHGEELYYNIVMNHPQVKVELLAGTRATKIDILSHMQKCDMVYYIGHTDYCDTERGQSSWLLKDDRLTSRDFENISTPPGLVFANSCESGREGSWEPTEKHLIIPKGVAGGFVMAGVTNYIGALWPIPAESSIVFANQFFEALLMGTPVGESVRQARSSTLGYYGKGNPIWAAYVLYGDPAHVHLSNKNVST